MIKSESIYKVLVHSPSPLLQEGFEYFLANLPVQIDASYQDLSKDLMSKLSPNLDLVILLENEADADFGLCYKIKLFLTDVPLLIIMPEAPLSYIAYLENMSGVHVLVSPFTIEKFNKTMELVLCYDTLPPTEG